MLNGLLRLRDFRRVPVLVWRGLSFVVAALVLYVFIAEWDRWEGAARYQVTDDAYLQADLTPLSAKIAGYVRSVPVQDFDHVHAGQTIVEIADDDYRASVTQAEANVSAADAQVEALKSQRGLLEANLRAAQAVVAATAATLEQNGRDMKRQLTLETGGSSSIETTEKIATTRAQLKAQLDQNHAQADAVMRQIDVLAAQTKQAEAALEAQRAALALARINLGYTRVVAPQDGVIGFRQVFPGQYIAPGSQVTTLAPLPHVWVSANYKETQLTHVAIGEEATVTVDAFPGHTLRGHVMAMAPASGAQFALLPPDNATGNFTKIVQRIAVKIAIDDADGLADELRPGMSVIATIDSRSRAGDSN
jgi:membrane fusion protein (multidrug efflux system)